MIDRKTVSELSELADKLADDIIQCPGEYHPNWHDEYDYQLCVLAINHVNDYRRGLEDAAAFIKKDLVLNPTKQYQEQYNMMINNTAQGILDLDKQ